MKTNCILVCATIIVSSLFSATAQNLILNGDFEGGNVSFTSEYTHSPGNLWPAQTYAVIADPRTAHSSWVSMGDHTSGSGLMMVVNGATILPAPTVWAQQITVEPNAIYYFSAWAVNVLGGSPSRFVFRVNGFDLEPEVVVPDASGVWRNYTTTWASGAAQSALLEIVFVSTVSYGNDSALDDLVFRKATAQSVGTRIWHEGDTLWLDWQSTTGVDYQVLSSSSLDAWVNEGGPVPGTNGVGTYSEAIIEARKFYRVLGLPQ